ncbi:MAG: Stp1/IreP family PP2C-type Ser/Thr phosphatase [Microscillaceae bacterium]|nr:Stp1/IreP family PP2C-type Ser/Thr phosphatase [Microscillaceae bacterium]MDW8460406.1 Stp1/IreP family PP2C-type Ser/Thr phosphatase [Cytophagales bacterium]
MEHTTHFRLGNHTDIGQVRRQNEDYMGYFDTPNGHLFVVCDGMGGHLGGSVASQMAVKSVRDFLQKQLYINPYQALREAIELANMNIFNYAQANAEVRGMGTTIVALLLQKELAYYAHVGDSRIYFLRNNQLKRLTKDHSVVQDMIDRGLITEEEAENHPRRNELRRALGTNPNNFIVDVCEEPILLYANDIFLLCSDGLTSLVSEKEIAQILQTKADVQAKAMLLVDKANYYGGYDNITVQVIELSDKLPQNVIIRANSLSKTDPEIYITPVPNPTITGNDTNPTFEKAKEPLSMSSLYSEPQETKKKIDSIPKPKREKIEYISPSNIDYYKIAIWIIGIVAGIWLAYYVWENSLKKVKFSNLWQNSTTADSTARKTEQKNDTSTNRVWKYITQHSKEAREIDRQYKKAKEGYKNLKEKVDKLRNAINDIIELKGFKRGKQQIDSLLEENQVVSYIYKGREDLEKVAKKYNIDVKKILEANNLVSDRALEVGKDTLFIPLEIEKK